MVTVITVMPPVALYMEKDDKPSFTRWKQRVGLIIESRTGFSMDDLPAKCPWKRWYADRIRPIHAANRALALAQQLAETYFEAGNLP